jgi:predicted nucleic acid-binding protein
LLDTTVLIDHLRGQSEVVDLLTALAGEGHQLGVCCINVAELYAGLSPQQYARANPLIDGLEFYDVSREAAKQAGRFKFDFARRGVTLTVADGLIAATATQEGATLITANIRDFPMKELQLLQQP